MVNLSCCHALTKLRVIFNASDSAPDQERTARCINNTLESLLLRPQTSPPLNTIILYIRSSPWYNGGEEDLVSETCAGWHEDVLLRLVEAGVCQAVRFEPDLLDPYIRLHGYKKDEELEYEARAQKCQALIRARFPRLRSRGLLTVAPIPLGPLLPSACGIYSYDWYV